MSSTKENTGSLVTNIVKGISTTVVSAGAGTVARGALNTLPVGSNPYIKAGRTIGAWALGAYAAKRASENLSEQIDETVEAFGDVVDAVKAKKDNKKTETKEAE